MKLAADVEFQEDIRLLIYRPHRLLNGVAINNALTVSEDLEAKLQEPFNRLSDTLAADEVELNFKYVIQFSLHRRLAYAGSSAGEVSDSRYRFHDDSLRAVACCTDSRFSYQCSCIPGPQRSRGMVA